jgi:signal transduction histidine kinase/ligand-binding sensor domain-containing protein
LWFCTRDGLSKFDGYQFTSYGKEQGLAHPNVNDLIEASDGTYWVATNGGGVCRFNPAERVVGTSASRFTIYSIEHYSASNVVNRLCEDRQGRIWAGTDQGLFYFEKTQDRFLEAIEEPIEIYSLLVDRQGALWIGASNQLWRRSPDGQMARYSFQTARDLGRIFSLLEDKQGRVWAGSWYAGLFELDPKQLPLADSLLQAGKNKGLLRQYTTDGQTPLGAVIDLHQSPDGHLWIVTAPDGTIGLGGGLFEFDGKTFRRYGKAQGLTSEHLESMAEDSEGNFWLGCGDGAMKIVRNGFTTFGEADGLRHGANAIFENQAGELCFITQRGMVINRFRDGRFIATRLNVPKALENSGFWGGHQITFQDRAGDWWVPTSQGLMRFSGVAQVEQLAGARPKAHYLLPGEQKKSVDIFRLFEDSRGDIWVGLGTGERSLLLKWERAAEKFHYYTEADGVPPLNPPTSFCEDAYGNLWIGLYGGGLLRYGEGRFTLFGPEDGLPLGLIASLYLDQSRRLWVVSSSDGVARIEDPGAESPAFVCYSTADGLSSNVVFSISEDLWGRMYFRTARGVDRLNPVSKTIKRYTAADGLPKGGGLCFRDASGALWFNGFSEVARLVPEPDAQSPTPPVFITGLRVTGIAQPVADLGEAHTRGLELAPSENHLQIDFVALAFGTGEALQYQYRLEGADADWQPLTELRTVNYANLAPGDYRFLVRAMNTAGRLSESPAIVEFRVLAPIWQRRWFIAIAIVMAGLLIYSLYRYHLKQRIEVERVRTRLATDLHDDIGANLSLIAMASEVARHRTREDDQQLTETLSLISGTSRELVDSMSDIVWAVNPDRDHLADLIKRMRRFASDVFSARGIAFRFEAPFDDLDVHLESETRREVLLIFKEAVNNIARHSECSQADIELGDQEGWLVLKLSDDGKGFDTTRSFDGSGLQSLAQRAERLGGKLEVDSRNGTGTTVTLKTPLR